MKNQQNSPSDQRNSGNKGGNRRRFDQRKPPRKFWRSLLTNKIFDLFIVVIGVTIAFQLYNWKQSMDEQKLEDFYIENMTADLTRDIAELKKGLAVLKSDYQGVVGYIEKFGQKTVVDDTLVSVISVILSLDSFDGNRNTYLTLMSSNGAPLHNSAIRGQVTEYYNQYNAIRHFEDVYTDVIFMINDYFSPYCDYTFLKVVDRSVLSRVETKNNLLIAAAHLEEGIESYEEALVMAEALKKNLEK